MIEWPTVPPNPVPVPPLRSGDPISDEQLVKLYDHTVRWQREELTRKDMMICALRDKVYAFHEEIEKLRAGRPQSAFEVLTMLANDPGQPAQLRLRAAEACVQFERPKLVATFNQNQNVSGIGERMDAARKRLEQQ